MIAPTLTVDVDQEALSALFKGLHAALNTEEILDESAALLLNRIRTRFLSEVDTEGTPWIPSKAGMRRRASGGTGTLFDTGRLFHSIQAAATGPNERQIGTDVFYGVFHQFGTAKLPKREFLGASQEDIGLMEKLIVLRVERALS